MKVIYFIFAVLLSSNAFALQINGVFKGSECKTKKAMVWLSLNKPEFKHKTLLMHTMVPLGGDFSFYVKPGDYEVTASDKKGCSTTQKFIIKKDSKNLVLKLEEK